MFIKWSFMNSLYGKLLSALGLLFFNFLFGVCGYIFIERWPVLDSIFMTVITLASVGYGETRPLTDNGRIFTILLIILGMSTYVYGISTITAFFVEGEVFGVLRRKRMQKKIDALNEHYIVCGASEVAVHIISELKKTCRSFVIIENDEDKIKQLNAADEILFINGEPSDDHSLIKAGIMRAKGIVCALPSDKDNLFVVITARSLNSDIRIVTRVIDGTSEAKLRRAGADAIVSTYAIGGLRMASELIRPTVVSYLDIMLRGNGQALRVEEIELPEDSNLIGVTVREAEITDNTGLNVLATKNKYTGNYEHTLISDYKFKKGDTLIVIGNPEQIQKFKFTYCD